MPTPMAILGEWVRLCGEPIRVIKMDTDTTIHEINIMLVARLFSCFLYTMSSRVIFIVLKCTYSRQDDNNIMVGMFLKYTMTSRVIFIVLKCTYSRQDDSNIMVGMFLIHNVITCYLHCIKMYLFQAG